MTFDTEIAAVRARMAANELDTAMLHLERAHVIGQLQVWPHVLSHWLMLKVELRRGRPAAAFGQFVRILLGALGSAVGVVPTGNTGGTDISMFQRLPVAPELQSAIDAQPRNVFAQSAQLAWVVVALMMLTMMWPEGQNLFIHKQYPATVGWWLLLATLSLAVLLWSPRLLASRREKTCKLLSLGLLIVSFFFVAPASVFCLGILTGKIFYDARARE